MKVGNARKEESKKEKKNNGMTRCTGQNFGRRNILIS
jgi:hypothetical protein